jgi:hypothetical protein
MELSLIKLQSFSFPSSVSSKLNKTLILDFVLFSLGENLTQFYELLMVFDLRNLTGKKQNFLGISDNNLSKSIYDNPI